MKKNLDNLISNYLAKVSEKHNYSAGILFFCPEDQTVLLVRRSGIMRDGHMWDIPGGRSESTDESVADTALREAKEELNKLPAESSLIGMHTIETKDSKNPHYKYYVFIYSVSASAKENWLPKIDLDEENINYNWFNLNDIPKGSRYDLSWVPEAVNKVKSAGLNKFASITMAPRFEYKYYIPSTMKDSIRDFILPIATADDHGQFYSIKNIYLDTSNLEFYKNHMLYPDRFKLRVRFYNDNDETFLEIKRKEDKTIVKQRSIIPQRFYPEVLADFNSNLEFVKVAHTYQVQPIVVIDYDREAFNAKDYALTGGRITFDDNIKYAKTSSYNKSQNGIKTIMPSNITVLELKFNGKMPSYMFELINKFALQRAPMSKYFKSVTDMLTSK